MQVPESSVAETETVDAVVQTTRRRFTSEERVQRARDSRRRYRDKNPEKVRAAKRAHNRKPEVRAGKLDKYQAKRQILIAEGLLVPRPKKQAVITRI